MSTLGKVLLFLNLLAAIGLAYLTAQDWNKRQEITSTIVRYQLLLQGLPTETITSDDDDEETVTLDLKMPAGTTSTIVRKKLLDVHFSGANGGDRYGGTPVFSMVDELKRAEAKLQSEIANSKGDGGDDAAGKLAFLVGSFSRQRGFEPGLLMKMAESYEERAAIKELAYPEPKGAQVSKNLEAARNRLKAKYDALLSAPAPAKAKDDAARIDALKTKIEQNPNDEATKAELARVSRDGAPDFTRNDPDRRRRITLFLLSLDPSGAWQKRVMLVAGLKTYHAALNEQVGRLAEIARFTERMIESDQATFESEYDLLKRLASRQDIMASEESRLVKGLEELEKQDAATLASRKTQLEDLQKELARLQEQIGKVLDAQAEAEKIIFNYQRQVGDLLKGNLELETKLGRTEQPKP